MIIAIAAIYDEFDDTLKGLRLLDTQTGQVKDADLLGVKRVLFSNTTTIANIKIRMQDQALVGFNGDINDLPRIEGWQLAGASPLIVINVMVNNNMVVGYTVTDYKGQIMQMTVAEAIGYAVKNGISNGKIVNNSNGSLIVPITKKYRYDIINYKPPVYFYRKDQNNQVKEQSTQSTVDVGHPEIMNYKPPVFSTPGEYYGSTSKVDDIDIMVTQDAKVTVDAKILMDAKGVDTKNKL